MRLTRSNGQGVRTAGTQEEAVLGPYAPVRLSTGVTIETRVELPLSCTQRDVLTDWSSLCMRICERQRAQ